MYKFFIVIIFSMVIMGCTTTTYVPVVAPCHKVDYKPLGVLPFYELKKDSTYPTVATACVKTASICRSYGEYIGGGNA